MTHLRLKCLACEVLARSVYWGAAQSPHSVDIALLRIGLHVTPNKLREALQAEIDAVDPESYDAVVLAYGLCGKATAGLRAGKVPLVLPRAHDCITLFLGGRERYTREFETCPGTYWYVQDFIERGDDDDLVLSIGAQTAGDSDQIYADYVAKYGKDNADYLMEAMAAWQAHYERAVYIDLGLGDGGAAAERRSQMRNIAAGITSRWRGTWSWCGGCWPVTGERIFWFCNRGKWLKWRVGKRLSLPDTPESIFHL